MARGLLLVAHGSRDPRAAAVALDVAAAVGRAAGVVAGAAFLELAEPSPRQALDLLAEQGVDAVSVQPFLLSHAYHSKIDLPGVVALVEARGWTARLGEVLGPDDLLIDALERRVGAAVEALYPPREYDGLVLAAAGSSDPEANRAVQGAAESLGERLGRPSVPGFASAARPSTAEAVARLQGTGVRRIVVATYLLAPGYFADRVRTEATDAGAVAVAAPLGSAPEIVDLVLRRANLP
ncbi:MAG TPA: sirohydrochlorin chelatase [Actinopolymorphaceae bacterium]|nr:sirohydrochlorin chelatase [Actinopolymorphaceae bacterium]